MDIDEGNFISFACQCGQTLRVPTERAGMKGRCKACGRKIVVPVPPRTREPDLPSPPTDDYLPPVARRDLQDHYSQDDLMTYPETPIITREAKQPVDVLREKASLFAMFGHILRYPLSDKQATQIFLTGAVLFSPLVWAPFAALRYLGCLGLLLSGVLFIIVVCVRLMYFSYLLLVIEKSAEGDREIPELPLFHTWEEHLNDLVKVLAASLIAFAPYLVYVASSNIELFMRIGESVARGQVPGSETMAGVTSSLRMALLLYAIAAFYMPMVLLTLVVTRNFFKAVNPGFILASIIHMGREYFVAMLIIFIFLRGSLTLFTILKDVLDVDWFSLLATKIGEPIIEFYVLVVTMHVIGLLYYRNGERLKW